MNKDKVKELISELRENIVTKDTKEGAIERMRKRRKLIKRSVNTAPVNREIAKLEQNISFLRDNDIKDFVCLKYDSEIYFNKIMEAIHYLADQTVEHGWSHRLDADKTTLWNFVGVLKRDRELLLYDAKRRSLFKGEQGE